MLKRSSGSTQSVSNEQNIFGENTATVVCMISATSTLMGKIIHINNEIEFLLGYRPPEIIGANVSCLMP